MLWKLYAEAVFSERILVLHTSIDYSLDGHEFVFLHHSVEATDKAQVWKWEKYLLRRLNVRVTKPGNLSQSLLCVCIFVLEEKGSKAYHVNKKSIHDTQFKRSI